MLVNFHNFRVILNFCNSLGVEWPSGGRFFFWYTLYKTYIVLIFIMTLFLIFTPKNKPSKRIINNVYSWFFFMFNSFIVNYEEYFKLHILSEAFPFNKIFCNTIFSSFFQNLLDNKFFIRIRFLVTTFINRNNDLKF